MNTQRSTAIIDKDLHYAIIILLVILPHILIATVYYFTYIQENQIFKRYLIIKSIIYLFLVYLVSLGIIGASEFDKTVDQITTKIQNTNVNINIIRKVAIRYLYTKTLSDILIVTIFLMFLFVMIPGIHMLIYGYLLDQLIFVTYVLYFIGTYIARGIYKAQLEFLLKNN